MSKAFCALKIAVFQTGRSIEESRAAHGDYDDMCKALLGRTREEADTYAVLEGQFPEDIRAYDLIVVTGSKHGVYEPHSWIASTETLIRQAYAAGIKLIGICFGHQIIAQALGGVVEKSDQGFILGAVDYEMVLPGGETLHLPLYAWHQDQVVDAPEGAEIIASSAGCKIAGLKYGNRALTLQPHPEFTKAYMKALIKARAGDIIDEAQGEAALASLETPVNIDRIQTFFKDFATS